MVSVRPQGFPGGSDGRVCLQCGRPGFNPWVGRSPGEGNGNLLQYYSGKSHGQRSLVGYSSWGCKESDRTERLHFHFCRKEYSLRLTWKLCGKFSGRTQSFHCRGHGFNLWLGNENPTRHARGTNKQKLCDLESIHPFAESLLICQTGVI